MKNKIKPPPLRVAFVLSNLINKCSCLLYSNLNHCIYMAVKGFASHHPLGLVMTVISYKQSHLKVGWMDGVIQQIQNSILSSKKTGLLENIQSLFHNQKRNYINSSLLVSFYFYFFFFLKIGLCFSYLMKNQIKRLDQIDVNNKIQIIVSNGCGRYFLVTQCCCQSQL